MHDIIIIGGGPSGMTAALYSLRNGKSVLILEKENFGGQIASSPRLENYPSIKEISGLDFSNNLFEQITDLGAEFELEEVESIGKKDDIFTVKTNYNTHQAKVVIIATGAKHRKMGLEREDKFLGHGLSYCATCDGAFFKDQSVVVVGDANTALQYSLLLSNYCKKVQICTLFDRFFADKTLIDQMKTKKNITYEHNLQLLSFDGGDTIQGLTFENTASKEIKLYKCDGVFIAIGQVPDNQKFTNVVALDNGFIVTDEKMETKTPGLYAIGDCRKKDVRQVVTAINDGAIAAVYASKYLG